MFLLNCSGYYLQILKCKSLIRVNFISYASKAWEKWPPSLFPQMFWLFSIVQIHYHNVYWNNHILIFLKYIHEIDDNHSCRRYLDCQSYVLIYISSEKCILDEISFRHLDNLINDEVILWLWYCVGNHCFSCFYLYFPQFEINNVKWVQYWWQMTLCGQVFT